MLLPDEHCPECKGKPETFYVCRTYLSKKCRDCGHRWNQERVMAVSEFVGRGGWVSMLPREWKR